MAVFEVTDATFDEQVVKNDGLTVVDFWAPWCGPCRMVGPVIEELAEEYEGRVRFAKLNVDDNQVTAGAFGVRSIPTIGFFRDGEPVGGVVGAYPKDALQEVIDDVLAGKGGEA
jgi:thioredoxin 1